MPKRQKRPRGSCYQAACEEAIQAQRSALLAWVPADRRHRVLGRTLDPETDAEELAALTTKIQGYIATGRCRVTSRGREPRE